MARLVEKMHYVFSATRIEFFELRKQFFHATVAAEANDKEHRH